MRLLKYAAFAVGYTALAFVALVAAVWLTCAPVNAQPVDSGVYAPTYLGTAGTRKEAQGTFCLDPVTGLVCSGGGGGGGGGDASAANQSVQITAANLTNTRIGDITTPATGTTNYRLGLISTTLGTISSQINSPFQAGGSIGNTAFGISGTLPAFASTPTFNLGTLNGAATAANQTTELGYLDGLEGLIGTTNSTLSTSNGYLSSLAGTVSAGNVNVVCTSGCSGGGGGSGYSVLNNSTYDNTSSYSNVPSGGYVTTAAPTYTTGKASPLSLDENGGLRVSGAFYQATQPISAASLPLPTGAATQTTLATIATNLGSPFQAGGSIGNTSFGATQSGTWNINNISGTVSLPTGAATQATLATLATQTTAAAILAKQPALGTAGTASSNVITVQGIASGTPLAVAPTIANPTSVLTRPANTTAYTAGDVVASNTTAGSIVVPSATAARVSAGSFTLGRVKLGTNATTGMSGVNLQMDLWTTAPTFTNGDNGAYAVATGYAGYVGTATVSLQQYADGAVGTATIADGPINIKLASGQSLYWTLQTLSAFTPASGQTFTATLEVVQN